MSKKTNKIKFTSTLIPTNIPFQYTEQTLNTITRDYEIKLIENINDNHVYELCVSKLRPGNTKFFIVDNIHPYSVIHQFNKLSFDVSGIEKMNDSYNYKGQLNKLILLLQQSFDIVEHENLDDREKFNLV